MVLKMLLDRRDLYNVRLSLDLDINSARHTHQLGHVITEEKEAIRQEVMKLSERWSAPVRRVLIHPLHVQLRITYATQLLKVCSLQSLRECRQFC